MESFAFLFSVLVFLLCLLYLDVSGVFWDAPLENFFIGKF